MSLAIEVQKQIDRAIGIPLIALVRGLGAWGLGGNRRRREAPARPRRVLLIKLWGLGNLTMVLPIAKALKERDPEVEVDLLTLAQNREFALPCPWLDRVHGFDPGGVPAARGIALALALRSLRYDLVLDFEQFLRASALLTAAAKPGFSVGFATRGQRRHRLFDATVACVPDRHMLHLFRAIARAGGLELVDSPERFVPRSRAAERRVRDSLSSWRDPERPLVCLHPGSGDNFTGRRWPADAFARLADLLVARTEAQVVFTGTAAEAPLVARVRRLTSGPSVDLSGRLSLLELVELLAIADLVVANDTAPVHFAAALDSPLLAIYGPNSPSIYGPLASPEPAGGAPNTRVLYRGLGCSPCLLNTNAKSSLCAKPLCMRSIDPLEAFEAAVSLLRRNQAPPPRPASEAPAAFRAATEDAR